MKSAVSQEANFKFVIRVPDNNLEIHSNNSVVDFRSNGSGLSNIKIGTNDITYNGLMTNTAYSNPITYPGTVNYISNPPGGGALVIECLPNPNHICFTICALTASRPIIFQNDFFVYSSNTLYRGNNLNITPINNGNFTIKVQGDVNYVGNYPSPNAQMFPCDNVHTFCGDAAQVTKIGDYYYVTCYPTANKCVSVNLDDGADPCQW